ncbi:S9 family peptidase [Salinibacter grassmerensis]|uniref:S9 family peptidase n=1 Tax=Salinibacter grassmerensis TaxID=3040353 RepID=UPI0021E98535|nr:S9 family peptidase [Salinibacter grassmerensis]
MTRRVTLSLVALLVLSVPTGPAQGQDGPEFTLERIHASTALRASTFQGGKWADQGPVITYIEAADSADATHLMRYNLRTDEQTRVIDGTNLYAGDVDRTVPIEDYTFSQAGDKVLIYTDSEEVWRANTKGYYYVYDLDAKTLTPVSDREKGYQMFAKFNPSATKVAFVRKRNLHVVDLATGTETALTTDGSEGSIINGTFDWVYEEEFGLRDGWQWSPDGRRIAFFKLDESETRSFPLTNNTTRYPETTEFRYPKAGEQNSEIKIGVVDLAAVDTTAQGQPQATQYFDTNTWNAGGRTHEYLARMGWTPEIDGTHRVWMYRLNRNQNVLDLLYGHPETGDTDQVLQDTQDTYIDVTDDKLTYLDGGEHFVFLSERTGYNHAHLYRTDGTEVGPITEGKWEVTQFHGVDAEASTAYVTGTRDTSLERHLYTTGVSFSPHEEAQPARKVTSRPGWHSINLSADRDYYIDQYSAAGTPPSWSLHEASGDRLTTLQANDTLEERLDSLDLPPKQFTSLPGADGTALNASIIKPNDFDPSRAYPVLMYVYGGPGVQTVTDQWGSSRQLWHQYLAQAHDVVVVSVDNRGTGGRGKAFQDVPYQRLGQPESADQIHAAQALADSAWVDDANIGIWGWSYGGYMTLMSMLTDEGPSTFDTGVSVAPVTDWRLYDTIYTERYMSTPDRNADGYENGAPQAYADRLHEDQNLLIVHGDDDDNVHFQNSVQMVNQLQSANKQFQFMMYPTHEHGIAGGRTRLHLFTMLTNHITEHLSSDEPAQHTE